MKIRNNKTIYLILTCVAIFLYGIIMEYFSYLNQTIVTGGILTVFAYIAYFLFKKHYYINAFYSVPVMAVLGIAIIINYVGSSFAFTAYEPSYVFTDHLSSKSIGIIIIYLSFYFILSLSFAGSYNNYSLGASNYVKNIIHLIKWPFLIFAVIMLYLTSRPTLITITPYASPGSPIIASPGLKTLAVASAGAIIGWGIFLEKQVRWKVFFYPTVLTSILSLIYFQFMRGERSNALAPVLMIGLLYYLLSAKSSTYKIKRLLLFGFVCATTLQLLAVIRNQFATGGLYSPILAYVNNFRLSAISVLPQMEWHLLHTIDLYESGNSLGGESFLNIVPQTIPGPIANALDYERPSPGSVLLSKYRPHGGGMFVVAYAYWNLGTIGVCFISLLISSLTLWLDKLAAKVSILFKPIVLMSAGFSLVSMFYGFQTFTNIFFVLGLLCLSVWSVKEVIRNIG